MFRSWGVAIIDRFHCAKHTGDRIQSTRTVPGNDSSHNNYLWVVHNGFDNHALLIICQASNLNFPLITKKMWPHAIGGRWSVDSNSLSQAKIYEGHLANWPVIKTDCHGCATSSCKSVFHGSEEVVWSTKGEASMLQIECGFEHGYHGNWHVSGHLLTLLILICQIKILSCWRGV